MMDSETKRIMKEITDVLSGKKKFKIYDKAKLKKNIHLVDLYGIYGSCLLPKGLLLYRGHQDSKISDTMFFALTYDIAKDFYCSPSLDDTINSLSENVQVWEIRQELKVIFLNSHLDFWANCRSSVAELFTLLYPQNKTAYFDDVYIKNENIKARNRFTNDLFNKCQINGWFTSIEGNTELEVCLFNKTNIAKHLQLKEVTTNKTREYYKNSLKKIKVFPSSNFISRSQDNLSKRKSPYRSFAKENEIWIKEAADDKKEESILRQDRYSLRHKLKI